jgi:hypothetical protein
MDLINVWIKRRFSPIRNRIISDKREDKTEENKRTNAPREREKRTDDDFFFVEQLVFDDAFSFRLVLMSWLLSA